MTKGEDKKEDYNPMKLGKYEVRSKGVNQHLHSQSPHQETTFVSSMVIIMGDWKCLLLLIVIPTKLL